METSWDAWNIWRVWSFRPDSPLARWQSFRLGKSFRVFGRSQTRRRVEARRKRLWCRIRILCSWSCRKWRSWGYSVPHLLWMAWRHQLSPKFGRIGREEMESVCRPLTSFCVEFQSSVSHWYFSLVHIGIPGPSSTWILPIMRWNFQSSS
jgi:hypothetical protein